MKKSPNWEKFMNEFFERSSYMQWHDGIDPSVLLELSKEELAEAEELLIESVKNGGMWPTVGLATIKSKKAIPVLKEKLKKSKGVLKIRIANALEKIEGTGEYIPILIEELRKNPSHYDRLEAAMNLGDYPTKIVIEALYDALLDSDYLVRYHSANSLLKIHNMKPNNISKYERIFQNLIESEEQSQGRDLAEKYNLAAKQMKDLLKKKTKKRYP
jgi:HEAT repeat protein